MGKEDLQILFEFVKDYKEFLSYFFLGWFGIGFLSELLWIFLGAIVRDVYPVLPKRKISQIIKNFLLGISGGLITFFINFYYINKARKQIRKDSDDNGGNFIRITPDSPKDPSFIKPKSD